MPKSILLAVVLLAPALSAADSADLPRGTRELGLSGTVYVSHDSPADVFGVIAARFGIYAFRNHQFGADTTVFAYSRIQDIYLSGFYRYSFARPERRLAPFVGAAAGANIAHFDYLGTGRSPIVKAQGGVRYFFSGKLSLDIGYDLMWRRQSAMGFTGKTSSIVTFGFSKNF
jgi:hypothetical protein